MHTVSVFLVMMMMMMMMMMIIAGANHGLEAFPAWTHELKDKVQIDTEINSFIK